MAKSRQKTEFGDFQTPQELASAACELLRVEDSPASILEPTCGRGNFIKSASMTFPEAQCFVGLDINEDYAYEASERLKENTKATVRVSNFFTEDWSALIAELPAPVLVIGNPPWVTNATLGGMGSKNRPERSNFLGFTGFEAQTGKANFDVSEWMLIKLVDALNGRTGQLAMLVKSAVARKVCHYVWKRSFQLQRAAIFSISAAKWFGAAVDACFLVLNFVPGASSHDAEVYPELNWDSSCGHIGYRDGEVVADLEKWERTKQWAGMPSPQWRSGIKHDCTAVMEFQMDGHVLRNGLGEAVDLEQDYLYPFLKTSDVARGFSKSPRFVLVTQKKVGDDTAEIARKAPKTWAYLEEHGEALDRRGSSIYKKQSRFAIFGVGTYTFTPWKVAISALYKTIRFHAFGPVNGKPLLVDDASYFLPAESEEQAHHWAALLNGPAKDFLLAHVFFDAKRPVTTSILNRLDLDKVGGVQLEARPLNLL